MKTTIELDHALLEAARQRARERGTTLRAIVEEGLRAVLARGDDERHFVLRDANVHGGGLRAGIPEGGWGKVSALIYEVHGGLIRGRHEHPGVRAPPGLGMASMRS